MGLSAFCQIRMADGSDKRAGDLTPGDAVLDPVTGTTATVTKVLDGPGVGMVGIETADGRVLHLTGDHPLHTPSGAVRAEQVRVGDHVLREGGTAVCSAAEAIPGDFKVHDVRGEGLAGLLANGIVVGI
jgi:hypothetical protein